MTIGPRADHEDGIDVGRFGMVYLLVPVASCGGHLSIQDLRLVGFFTARTKIPPS